MIGDQRTPASCSRRAYSFRTSSSSVMPSVAPGARREMTAAALAKVSGKKFSSMKIAMDCTVVALSILASLLFFRNPWGDGQYVVIGIGTVLCAVLIGLMMKLTDPLVARLVRRRAWNS